MKPAEIASLLVQEYEQRGRTRGSLGALLKGKLARMDYLDFLRTIANGSNRNTNVQKGYAAAVRQIEGGT